MFWSVHDRILVVYMCLGQYKYESVSCHTLDCQLQLLAYVFFVKMREIWREERLTGKKRERLIVEREGERERLIMERERGGGGASVCVCVCV